MRSNQSWVLGWNSQAALKCFRMLAMVGRVAGEIGGGGMSQARLEELGCAAPGCNASSLADWKTWRIGWLWQHMNGLFSTKL